jgi:hypothetical protein
MYITALLLCMAQIKDNNGSIENEELRGFLKDLLELAKKVRKTISQNISQCVVLRYLA